MPSPFPYFLDVDPRTLFITAQRAPGADPWKFQTQLSRYGLSVIGMPPITVWVDPDGRLMIANGVTRAIRVAKFLPGVLVRVEVTQDLKRPLRFRRTVADVLP